MILTFTKTGERSPWVSMGEVLLQEAAFDSDRPPTGLMLMTNGDESELPALVAGIRLIRRCYGSSTCIHVGTNHPSRIWATLMRKAGVDELFFVRDLLLPPDRAFEAEDQRPVRGEVCPHLNIWSRGESVHSVCGQVRNRMILAPKMMEKHCIGAFRRCSYFEEDEP